jgi:endoribonuclease L-PSP
MAPDDEGGAHALVFQSNRPSCKRKTAGNVAGQSIELGEVCSKEELCPPAYRAAGIVARNSAAALLLTCMNAPISCLVSNSIHIAFSYPKRSGEDIFVRDLSRKKDMDAVWTEFFGDHLPTRATVGVADLGGNTLIEVVVTALKS